MRQVLAEAEQAASAVEEEYKARQQAYRERIAQQPEEESQGRSDEEVRRYFMEHLERKQQQDKGEAAVEDADADAEDSAAQVCHWPYLPAALGALLGCI